MSELIDSIYNVEKISAEQKAIADLILESTKQINTYKDAIVALEKETRKTKGTEELINNTKLLNDNVVKGGVEMKRYEAEVAKLKEKTEQLTNSEKAASIEIAKARLELQAAQKATKEAAIAEIELTAKNKDLSGSYNALQKDLTNSIKAYKALSGEEANSAKGKELLAKIGETQSALKKSDAAMGNYQRNVGNYASAIEGLTPKLGGLAGTLLDIARAAKKSKDELEEMGGGDGLGIMSNPKIPAGLSTIMTGLKGIGQSAIAMGKAFLANPIGVMIIAVAGAFALVNSAIKSNGQATEKLGQVMAPFKVLLGGILNVVGKMVSTFLDGVLVFAKFANAVMSVIPGLDTLAAKNSEAIALEKEKQRLIRAGIVDKAADAKEELRLAELRKKIMEKDKYNAEERLAMAKDIDKSEKAMALDDADRANRNLKSFLKDMKLKGKVQKDYTIEELQQLTDLQTAKYKEQQAYFDKTKKLAGRTAALQDELAADNKAKADEEKANNEKIIASRRRLVDSQLALMTESKEKDLAISAEKFKREIEDTKATGQLLKNLTTSQQSEVSKIKNDWAVKYLNDKIKADELILDNMKKGGEDTLNFEKQLLNKRMEAEILAGANAFEVKEKYRFLELDLVAKTTDEKIALFQKEIEKTAAIMQEGYDKQARDLKKQFSQGKMSREEYEKALAKIQLDALLEVNQKTIAALRTQLDTAELSKDKRAELSKQLADLEIANENAVTDATIKAKDDQVAADEDAKNKRVEIANALGQAAGEIFGAIADFQTEKSEQRIGELEKEQELSDSKFEKDQENLDNAIMSDETRAQKEKELTESKAASDKAIADKIQAEKIKQAKWEKANALVQAIIAGGLAVLNAAQAPPPLGFITAAAAGVMAAIQIATIASKQIPAFADGGISDGGLALWGEVRPEIAVTPSGDAFLAERPTVTDFDAGTRIYKSVADYEKAMGAGAGGGFSFDYDKMAEKMPQQVVNFDSRGLIVVSKKNVSRTTMINRRYKIGN